MAFTEQVGGEESPRPIVRYHDERFHVSICTGPIERARKDGERSIFDMHRLIERFERYFLERPREGPKESPSLSIYPFFTFLLTTASVFVPFVDPFAILSLSFRGQCNDRAYTEHIVCV